MAGDEEIWKIVGECGLGTWIATLPDGLSTLIGEKGLKLSSGQAQRVAFARAFLKNSPMVILDEPTAHLDTVNESEMVQLMSRLFQGKTVLLIAHRLPTLQLADQVVVLEEGRIVEQGELKVLTSMPGTLRQMIQIYEGDQA